MSSRKQRIKTALKLAHDFAIVCDAAHHKQWLIDQMVRALTGCPTVVKRAKDHKDREHMYQALGESLEYLKFVRIACASVQEPDTYKWDTGITP